MYSRGELIDELVRLKNEHNKVVADTVREHSKISLGPFKDRFGSWNEAKESAGLETYGRFEGDIDNGIRGYRYAEYIINSASCCNCGLDETVCIEFHHVGNKYEPISKLAHESQGHSSSTVYKELQNTLPLCANCHCRHHSDSHNFVATEDMIPEYPSPKEVAKKINND